MRVDSFSFTFGMTPSRAYNSVKAEITVNISLDSSDDFKTVRDEVVNETVIYVADVAEPVIGEMLRRKQEYEGQSPQQNNRGGR